MSNQFIASSSPHIKDKKTTTGVMLDVIIALLPATIMGMIFFGWRAILNICVSVITCVFAEWLWNRCLKRTQTIQDLSAVVTGLLLALVVSPMVPFWMLIIGGFFSMIIVKQFFGGIGMNFLNPALAGRAMMMASWPVAMTTWLAPQWLNPTMTDALSGATPLALQKIIINNSPPELAASVVLPTYQDLALGNVFGSIGETCAVALLIGFIYLLIRRIISWEIPVIYCAVTALFSWALGQDPIFNLLSGGLLIGAIFMATDYTTSPMTKIAKVIYAVGCGLLTVLIRVYGGYPEGVSYAILLMNLVVPLLDKAFVPKSFGTVKEKAKGGR